MAAGVGTPSHPSISDEPLNPASDRRDALLVGLTFAAGIVDAVSYLGLGRIFTANMTGNVVFLALAIGQRSLLTALHSAGAVLGFALGATVAGQLLVRPRPPGLWPRQVTRLLWVELACLAAFAVIWVAAGGQLAGDLLYLAIGLSSFGMGFQNAAARHVAVPGLTTTVLTGALTVFMVDLPAIGISGTGQRRAGWTVAALFSGAGIGATLVVYARVVAPLLTVVVVGAVALVALVSFRGGVSAHG